jgi:regulatory protein
MGHADLGRDPAIRDAAVVICKELLVAGVITALESQSKSRNRLNVHLNGEYSFSLARILAYELKVGQKLSSEQIANLKQKDAEEATYKRAQRLISHRPRSEFELRTNFKRHRVPSEVQESVLIRLREAKLVDDMAFAETWVENRFTFRPRSALALRMELRKKGVPKETIEAALEGYDDEHAAHQAARKAAHRWKNSNRGDFKKRVGAYLARRGFDYTMISPVVERVWRETTGVQDESEVYK